MRTSALLRVLGLAVALVPATARADAGLPPHAAGRAGPVVPDVPGLPPAEVADLLEGRGAGLARVADVLGYPGPRHVLDAWSAGQLSLEPAQVARIEAIFAAMAREAQGLGARVVDAERALAAALQAEPAATRTVDAHVARIAALRGALRGVHLRAHLETRAVLDPAQLARYAELRGQAPRGGGAGHGH
jgi:Spy/CpxP family protein refolding chaperone